MKTYTAFVFWNDDKDTMEEVDVEAYSLVEARPKVERALREGYEKGWTIHAIVPLEESGNAVIQGW